MDKRLAHDLPGQLEEKTLASIACRLLKWFRANARDLPWRKTRDPYAIWISEVMLQQTQVKTVIPYWERWMRALPDIGALAAADLNQVLKLWEGLGYYSRARNLQRAAGVLITQHGGRFPTDHAALLALPGIGRYTAGAICSLAFDQPEPILDGNIVRVLTRLFAWRDNPKTRIMQDKLWRLAEQLVMAAGRFRRHHPTPHNSLNQSLMELGATLCSPREPDCPHCPLNSLCEAHRQGIAAQVPMRTAKVPVEERRHVVFILRHGDRFFARQRPAQGVVNAGLWEFPQVEVKRRLPRDLLPLAHPWVPAGSTRVERLGSLVHHITRYRHRLTICRIVVADALAETDSGGRWHTRCGLERLALTGAHRKIARQFIVDSPD
jgi:A/G-specific adenine glycosylase